MRWVRRLLLALFLAFAALALLGAYTGYRLSHPSPEDFHPAVQVDGSALRAALEAAPARRYLSGFRFQDTWSTCGPASLRNVLASLGGEVASERALFGEDRLAWWKALGMGMTLEELAGLARANTARTVEVLRPESLDAFRAVLAGANAPGTRLIVNFDRAPLFGVSVGHFSPVGGYDPETGLVTLLDVTEGYGFSLVPDRLLFRATRAEDPMSGRARGLLRIADPAPASGWIAPSAGGAGVACALPAPGGQSSWTAVPEVTWALSSLQRCDRKPARWATATKSGSSGVRSDAAARRPGPIV